MFALITSQTGRYDVRYSVGTALCQGRYMVLCQLPFVALPAIHTAITIGHLHFQPLGARQIIQRCPTLPRPPSMSRSCCKTTMFFSQQSTICQGILLPPQVNLFSMRNPVRTHDSQQPCTIHGMILLLLYTYLFRMRCSILFAATTLFFTMCFSVAKIPCQLLRWMCSTISRRSSTTFRQIFTWHDNPLQVVVPTRVGLRQAGVGTCPGSGATWPVAANKKEYHKCLVTTIRNKQE